VTPSPGAFRPGDFGIGRLFAAVSDAVIVGDIETGMIVLWNPAAEELFGHTAADAVGRPLSLIVAESLRAQHEAGLARYRVAKKGPIVGRTKPVEVRARARDGREFPVELTLSRIEDDPRHLLAIVRDISDRKAVRDAHELEQQRREFFASASHELKTPLTAVSGYLQLAERHLQRGRSTEALTVLGSARRRAEQMAQLIDDLLNVSRIEAGRFTVRRSRIDLRETLEHMVGEYAAEKPGQLKLSLATEPVVVEADPARIQQVVDNLLTNALKYGAGNQVDVELATQDGAAVLRVRDRGIGVPDADRSQLFMAFYRTSNSSNIGGTGLGLFISRRIAELHGGRLNLESSGPDGSVFAFEIPLAMDD
jgi:protein-histidine pros-kinase